MKKDEKHGCSLGTLQMCYNKEIQSGRTAYFGFY